MSRITTHPQTLHRQAMLTGERLKGHNKGKESKQPQVCSEKSHDTNCGNSNWKFKLPQLVSCDFLGVNLPQVRNHYARGL